MEDTRLFNNLFKQKKRVRFEGQDKVTLKPFSPLEKKQSQKDLVGFVGSDKYSNTVPLIKKIRRFFRSFQHLPTRKITIFLFFLFILALALATFAPFIPGLHLLALLTVTAGSVLAKIITCTVFIILGIYFIFSLLRRWAAVSILAEVDKIWNDEIRQTFDVAMEQLKELLDPHLSDNIEFDVSLNLSIDILKNVLKNYLLQGINKTPNELSEVVNFISGPLKVFKENSSGEQLQILCKACQIFAEEVTYTAATPSYNFDQISSLFLLFESYNPNYKETIEGRPASPITHSLTMQEVKASIQHNGSIQISDVESPTTYTQLAEIMPSTPGTDVELLMLEKDESSINATPSQSIFIPTEIEEFTL